MFRDMSFNDKKILVITSCSAKKRQSSKLMQAIDLYNGGFFNQIKKFVKLHKFDLKIISAKYGLLSAKDKISNYNQRIKNNNDIFRLQKLVNPKLISEIPNYDRVLILMGGDYKQVIESLVNYKFVFFFDRRGIGGYKSLMTSLFKLDKKNLFKLLFQEKENTITIDTINKYLNNFQDLSNLKA